MQTEGPLREHLYEGNFKSIECYRVYDLQQRRKRFCNLVINIYNLFFLARLDLELSGPSQQAVVQMERVKRRSITT